MLGKECEMSRQVALDWIERNEKRAILLSDRIWELAELGLREYKSSKLLTEELVKAGFRVDSNVAGMPTAFVGAYGSGKPMIGLLAEYDALPGLSQKAQPTREPFRENDAGHGCGHNLLGVGSLVAALAMREAIQEKRLNCTVKLFGCPAEETLTGKAFMAKEGLFDDLDVALVWHPDTCNSVMMSSTNAMNSVEFIFHGVASHAATNPEKGKSALDAVELMNVGANYLREHIGEKCRLHYVITHGGKEPNVVPDYAQVWYYVRAPKRREVERVNERLVNIAKGACLMTEAKMETKLLSGCYDTLPNKALGAIMMRNMKEIGAPRWSQEELKFAEELVKSITYQDRRDTILNSMIPKKEEKLEKLLDDTICDAEDENQISPGSTDVGDVSWITPTTSLMTAASALGIHFHSWQQTACSGMSIGHKGMLLAAKTLALTGIDLITKPEELEKVREEFAAKTKAFVYESHIPREQKPSLDWRSLECNHK